MGTFIGHFVPGLSLVFLGLWHTINAIRSYSLKGSDNFVVRFWYPFPKFKHLELISVFFLSLLMILLQILNYPSFDLSFKLENFEHATMFLQLAIFACFALLSELTHSSDIFSQVTGILVASVFGQELFLLHFHSTDHVGLEGHYHFLLQLIVSVSFISAIILTSKPKSLSASLVLSASVLFQGCWFLNMGFMLWVPKYVPKGCISIADARSGGHGVHSAVACESPAADMRARAIANLQFSWIFSAVLVLTGCVCLKYGGKYEPPLKCQSTEYERLCRKGVESPTAIDGFTKSDP